jgi:hypothetical protein
MSSALSPPRASRARRPTARPASGSDHEFGPSHMHILMALTGARDMIAHFLIFLSCQRIP